MIVVWIHEKKVKVSQLCPTLCDPMDCIVMEFSRTEYWSGYSPWVFFSHIVGWIFTS